MTSLFAEDQLSPLKWLEGGFSSNSFSQGGSSASNFGSSNIYIVTTLLASVSKPLVWDWNHQLSGFSHLHRRFLDLQAEALQAKSVS